MSVDDETSFVCDCLPHTLLMTHGQSITHLWGQLPESYITLNTKQGGESLNFFKLLVVQRTLAAKSLSHLRVP